MPTIPAMLSSTAPAVHAGGGAVVGHIAPAAHAAPFVVSTLLAPSERPRVDTTGAGAFVALHRDSVDGLLADLRSGGARGVLVSVARYRSADASALAGLTREFPRATAVALLSSSDPRAAQSVLALGLHGIRALVDARDPRGWRELRELFTSERGETIEQRAIRLVRADLAGAGEDILRFVDALFLAPPRLTTVQALARGLGVLPTTFMSRFFRAGLPAPKRYLAEARLVRAARLLENPGLSITHVTNHLEYSSPQSFSRHVQLTLGCTAAQFRRTHDGERMLDRMREELVLPYASTLRHFEPFLTVPGWSVLRDRRPARVAEPPAPNPAHSSPSPEQRDTPLPK